MGGSDSKPVIFKDPDFIVYTKMLASVRLQHPEFDFKMRGIVYLKDNNILFKVLIYIQQLVYNKKDNQLYYLQQIPIKFDEEIELILKQIQLSAEMADGFLLSYYTSFALKQGTLIVIIYNYIELISLEKMYDDENFQEQRIFINQQVQSQIFSIYYLLNQNYLSINNLKIDNIFIYQNKGQINVKLINIELIKKNEYLSELIYWKLENYEVSLIDILRQLNKRNIEKNNDSQQLYAVINELSEGKYKLQDVQDHFRVCQEKYTLIDFKNIQMIQEKNLNQFLLKLNMQIKNQQLNNLNNQIN